MLRHNKLESIESTLRNTDAESSVLQHRSQVRSLVNLSVDVQDARGIVSHVVLQNHPTTLYRVLLNHTTPSPGPASRCLFINIRLFAGSCALCETRRL